MTRSVFCTTVLLFIATTFFVGCGNTGGGSDEEYKSAIKAYLTSKSYGMVVSSVKSSKVDDGKATVVCKVKDAEGLYGLAVTWNFTLENTDGTWKVLSHSTR
jgi:hypothetical protein